MPDNKEQVTLHKLLLSVNVTQDSMIELLHEKGIISKAELAIDSGHYRSLRGYQPPETQLRPAGPARFLPSTNAYTGA